MQMLAQNPLRNQGEPRYPFSMERLVEPSMHRRRDLFRMIEHSERPVDAEHVEATAVEQFAVPIDKDIVLSVAKRPRYDEE